MNDNWHGFYLNLNKAKTRRKTMDKQIEKFRLSSYISRKQPISLKIAQEYTNNYTHNLNLSEISLYLSMQTLLKENQYANKHLLILEDDSKIGHNTREMLNTISSLKFDDDILILDCDMNFYNLETMNSYLKIYNNFNKTKEYLMLEAKERYLLGANAILYNKNSLNKIHKLIEQSKCSSSYDLLLRELINQNKIKAKIIFPFAIGINSKLAETSQLIPVRGNDAKLIKAMTHLREQFFIMNSLSNTEKLQKEIKKKFINAKRLYLKVIKHYINIKPENE